ncbi:IS630 family transposase [Crassaminicella indica]|uniref:IS630 family transposase n=1 Tax=Crassaminicella indica TaxID=2855394 RepID=UPI002105A8F6|nr:IS630 family transposase [Crassaminicella indica]
MIDLVSTVENDSESVLYVMDETGLRTESDNRRSWSLVGVSPILESNGSHEGVNIIGATEITKNFDTVADIYSAKQSITSEEIQSFMEYLLECNPSKKVYLVLDNARTHNNVKIQEFWESNKERLVLINTPAYSPQLNPQENIWNLLKNKIFNIGARENIEVLFDEIASLYDQFNEDKELIKSIVYGRNYYYKLPDIGLLAA